MPCDKNVYTRFSNLYYKGWKVTPEQAKQIRSVGGRIDTRLDDKDIWRNWS